MSYRNTEVIRGATGCTQPVSNARVEYNPWHPTTGVNLSQFPLRRSATVTREFQSLISLEQKCVVALEGGCDLS